jgi:GGDEF domain-containing protein
MDAHETWSTFAPLLRSRLLRLLLIGAPGITAAAGIVTAQEENLALVAALNGAAGIAVSSLVFVAVSFVARKASDERVSLAQAAEQGFWRARTQLVSIHHDTAGFYTDWYLRLRLEEELDRAKRYDLSLSLLAINPTGIHQDTDLITAADWLGDRLRRQLRKSDLPAVLRDGRVAVLLPNTSSRSARTLRNRLRKELQEIDAEIGLAGYPEDGQDAETLLAAAVSDSEAKRTAA